MGGAVTTVLDLWRWHRALLGDTVLAKEARGELFRPFLDGYACGWFVTTAVHGGPCIQHGGSVRGFTSLFRRYPGDEACIVLLANDDGVPLHLLADNLECILFGKPLQHAEPAPVAAIDGRALEEYAGIYRGPDDARLTVRPDQDSLVVGIEGQEALWALTTIAWPNRPPDLDAATMRALDIVRAVTKGDPEPLRNAMAQGIPPAWPDQVVREIWPAHVMQHGPLQSLRALGAVTAGRHIRVVLALEHENTSSRVKVEFDRAGLRILDWNGPEFPATIRLLPTGTDTFVEQKWQQPKRFRFSRRGGRVAALELGSLAFTRE